MEPHLVEFPLRLSDVNDFMACWRQRLYGLYVTLVSLRKPLCHNWKIFFLLQVVSTCTHTQLVNVLQPVRSAVALFNNSLAANNRLSKGNHFAFISFIRHMWYNTWNYCSEPLVFVRRFVVGRLDHLQHGGRSFTSTMAVSSLQSLSLQVLLSQLLSALSRSNRRRNQRCRAKPTWLPLKDYLKLNLSSSLLQQLMDLSFNPGRLYTILDVLY